MASILMGRHDDGCARASSSSSSSSWRPTIQAKSLPAGTRLYPWSQLSFVVADGSCLSRHSAVRTPRRHHASRIVSKKYLSSRRTIASAAAAMPHRQSSSTLSSSSSLFNANNDNGEQSVEYHENNNDEDDDDGINNIMNGVYLDQDTYLQAENTYLRSDGSLNLSESNRWGVQRPQSMEGSTTLPPSSSSWKKKQKKNAYQMAVEGLFSPPPRYSYYSDDEAIMRDDASVEDTQQLSSQSLLLSDEEQFYQAVMDIENGRGGGGGSGRNANDQSAVVDPEVLHRQVFAEEEAYLQQSADFRNALNSLFTDNKNTNESPMAKGRREIIEQYNERVLSDLMKEIDEMEDMALSREDAIMGIFAQDISMDAGKSSTLANSDNTPVRKGGPVSCSKCGLRVTPDMMQRAALINQKQQRAKGSIDELILCSACYGKQFVTKEAELRVPASEFASSLRMFEKRNTRLSSKNEVYNSSGRSRSKERVGNGGQGRSNNIQGISTESLFDVPKGIPSSQSVADDAAPKNTPIINTTSRSSSSSPTRTTSSSDYRQQRFLRRSSSRILGGAELAKRMQQRESEVSQGGGLDDVKHSTSDGTERSFMVEATERKASVTNRGMRQPHKTMKDEEESVDDANYAVNSISGDYEVPTILVKTDNDEEERSLDYHWVKVEDPSTKRSFYWNTETGEMKRSE